MNCLASVNMKSVFLLPFAFLFPAGKHITGKAERRKKMSIEKGFDCDICFPKAYDDGDNLYFDSKQLETIFKRLGFDEKHIAFLIGALIDYELKWNRELNIPIGYFTH